MPFQMGDIVYHKSNTDISMTVHGFMTIRSENFIAASTETDSWVLCKWIKSDGTPMTELFYDLELIDDNGED